MEKHFEQLAKIYNTLLLVSTKGEDTVIMGQCLSAMRDVLAQAQEDAMTAAKAENVNE